MSRLLSTERKVRIFRDEADRCIQLAGRLPAEQARLPVVIARFPGIEDSSRGWSVYMTLQHLVIVGSAILAGVPRLAAGKRIDTAVKIEDVKPAADAGPEQLRRLADLADGYASLPAAVGAAREGSRLRHPWFGDLNASEWLTLAAVHNRIHRHQIERIIASLS
jgi:hypothetical protein